MKINIAEYIVGAIGAGLLLAISAAAYHTDRHYDRISQYLDGEMILIEMRLIRLKELQDRLHNKKEFRRWSA